MRLVACEQYERLVLHESLYNTRRLECTSLEEHTEQEDVRAKHKGWIVDNLENFEFVSSKVNKIYQCS